MILQRHSQKPLAYEIPHSISDHPGASISTITFTAHLILEDTADVKFLESFLIPILTMDLSL